MAACRRDFVKEQEVVVLQWTYSYLEDWENQVFHRNKDFEDWFNNYVNHYMYEEVVLWSKVVFEDWEKLSPSQK